MASAFTHAAAALALGTAFRNPGRPARFWVLGALFAAAPDLDAIGYWIGVPYESDFGHRGFSHSFFFAAILAAVGLLAFLDREWRSHRARIWLFLCLATASHGLLDAITSGGGGVAFFAPFHNERYFFPWRPILVSPMSVRRFFTERGLRVLATELVWVWLPAATFAAAALAVRRRSRGQSA
jgi:inner membrane protein